MVAALVNERLRFPSVDFAGRCPYTGLNGKTEGNRMSKRLRTMLCFAIAAAALLLTVYLSMNQADYDKRTLQPYEYQDMATGPLFFEKGSYTVLFSYVYTPGAQVQIVRANTADADNRLPMVLASAPLDESGKTSVSFTLDETVYDLQLRYTAETELGYTNIESAGPVWRDTAFILLLIAGVIALFCRMFWREQKDAAPLTDAGISPATIHLLLVAVALYASLPIFREYFTTGLDLPFHLTRIEGVKDGLLDGQFPVRIAPTYNGGVGYASSTMYPELLLYIPAVLRLCGVSLMTAYQGFVFIVNLATLLVTYHAMKRLTGKATLGLIISLVYSLGVYRMSGVYGRVFLGETLAMIFFPCVMLGMVEVLHRGKLSKWLIAGMTGLIQTHIVSVEIAVIFCALYTLLALVLRKTNGRALLMLCAAAGITALLNLWFLVPFLRFWREDFNMFDYYVRTKDFATYFQQMFASFLQPFGSALYLGETAGEMPISVGLLPGLGILLFILVQRQKNEDNLHAINRVSLLMALIALLAASTLFPWTYIVKIPVLGELLYSIQFPFRYLSAASLFLAIVFAVSAYHLAWKHPKILIAVCIVLAVFNTAPILDQFIQSDQQTVVMESKSDGSITSIVGLRDYYYADSDFYALSDQPAAVSAPEMVEISNYTKYKLQVAFDYTSDTAQSVTLPLYNYPGYRAVLNGSEDLAVLDGENHLLALSLPAGVGSVSVWYEGFWYYSAANFISLASVLVLGVWAALKRRRTLC